MVTLRDETRNLVLARAAIVGFRALADELGADHLKLYRFATGRTKRIDVNECIKAYEYLSGNKVTITKNV